MRNICGSARSATAVNGYDKTQNVRIGDCNPKGIHLLQCGSYYEIWQDKAITSARNSKQLSTA